jgi:alkyl sulfatase BDS1-like metallo-beta-lactamase superfamily hydrolase
MVPDHNDTADFTNARRGLIKSLLPCTIYKANGDACWDSEPFSFLTTEIPLATVNSSLKRQSPLCLCQGLFLVTDGVYQIRGLHLSNIPLLRLIPMSSFIDPLIIAVKLEGLAAQYESFTIDWYVYMSTY